MAEKLPNALAEVLRQIANLIADGDWEILARLTIGSRVVWPDVARVTSSYGHTFIHLPSAEVPMDGVRVQEGIWSVRCPLWTYEEGRSDLEIQATAHEVSKGIWRVHVDDVVVP